MATMVMVIWALRRLPACSRLVKTCSTPSMIRTIDGFRSPEHLNAWRKFEGYLFQNLPRHRWRLRPQRTKLETSPCPETEIHPAAVELAALVHPAAGP